MDKQEIYDFLEEKNIWHEITEHRAAYNMAELSQIDIPYPEADAKNPFVRDDKKRNYYTELKVKVFIDRDFMEAPGLIGVHLNHNTATVWLKTGDMVHLIEAHGNLVELVEV